MQGNQITVNKKIDASNFENETRIGSVDFFSNLVERMNAKKESPKVTEELKR
jgi:hypothetical protein